MSTEDRLLKLEDEVKNLKNSAQPSCEVVEKKKKVKSGVKREASKYNIFVKNYIDETKKKCLANDTPFAHKEAFKMAAVAWNLSKTQPENKE